MGGGSFLLHTVTLKIVGISVEFLIFQTLKVVNKSKWFIVGWLPSEMEWGVKLLSIDRSPFKEWTSQHKILIY